jgi:cytochrome b561
MSETGKLIIRDTHSRFGLVSVLLHWTNAAFIFALLYLGIMGGLVIHGGHGKHDALQLHVSLALLALPFFVARIFWRTRHGKPEEPDQSPFMAFVANSVWKLLLVGIVLQMLVGPFLNLTHHRPIELFGLELVPAFLPGNEFLHDKLAKPIHTVVGLSMVGLIGLHAAGAVKHFVIDRDHVLQRILWPFAKASDRAAEPAVSPAE